MTTNEVRKKYLEFFAKNGHKIVPSSRLVPENDPTTLFTGSGMQPMVPYLLGEKHPEGNRITDSQKSFRAGDIDDIGDNRHTTFFEMLGNWSLGDYFKEKQIPWMFEFLIDELRLDPNKVYVSTFIGDEKNGIPKDIEAGTLWKELFKSKGIDAKEVEIGSEENGYKVGMQGGRIFYYDVKKNWWSRAGVPDNMPANEPGGPDSEMFYEFTDVEHDTKYGEYCHPNCDCGRFMEIGNNVFMEYKKNTDGTFSKLPQKNIDFGGGLERIVAATMNTSDVFQIDTLQGIVKTLESLSGKSYNDKEFTSTFRVIADHIRASTFLIGDGVTPSNTEQGYFVRRLLRRAIRFWDKLGIQNEGIFALVTPLLEFYKDAYPETFAKKDFIADEIKKEEEKFRKTLSLGLKELNKYFDQGKITGEEAFILFSSYGFPIEITAELAKEKNISIDMEAFNTELKKHQDLSRVGSEQKFKGGLGDTSDKSLQYHTATHLLQQALRDVLGPEIGQKGSNITPERLRFDFSYNGKMTDEQKKRVEDIVNQKIAEALPVQVVSLPKEEAVKTGAIHFFGEKYPDTVTVYFVGNTVADAFSKEFCGGPHVKNTSELKGTFKIQKEEAVSQGVRRIKAVLE
ncbi:MAG: alaS [Candidatus Taylorbacteria bacterium]|nr:alaS [Candidatus Taylorbacteria bacterium]